jgi:hypothetical protein
MPQGTEWWVIGAILLAPFLSEGITKLLSLFRKRSVQKKNAEAKSGAK